MAKRKRADYVPPKGAQRPPTRASREHHRSAVAEQRARAEEAKRRAGIVRRTILAGVALALLVVAMITYLLVDRGRDADLQQALTAGSCTTDSRSDPTGGPGENHRDNPTFAVDPPSGGNHTAQAAKAGVYAGTTLPPDGHLVHSLEHGYVILWHRPDLPAAGLNSLKSLATKHQGDVIVAERRSMTSPVAATGWERRLLCGAVEPAVLDRFIEAYVGKGPEKVPRG
ncbi:MAG TPA: DUF3105 domain-containing protein [Mycobacteriales bacterium]|nr:DUF3105 domain-containing protein [Mycobacteriales bacterium]